MRLNCIRNRYSIIGNNNTIYIHTPHDHSGIDCDWFLDDIPISTLVFIVIISIIFICIVVYFCHCLCCHRIRNCMPMPLNIISEKDARENCLCINSKV